MSVFVTKTCFPICFCGQNEFNEATKTVSLIENGTDRVLKNLQIRVETSAFESVKNVASVVFRKQAASSGRREASLHISPY